MISDLEPPVHARGGIRVLDFAICTLLLLPILPVLFVLMLAIRLEDGGPALFAQRRIGWDGRSFRCFKLRTMCLGADARLRALLASDPEARGEWARDRKLRRDPRVTRIGGLLRKLSLDELPQILNVLRGDMSLVGPRPIVAAEAERYGARFWAYCRVRPGITGLWQVSGRNDVDYRRRIAMDVLFTRRLSVGLYLGLLLRTPAALLLRRGAY